VTFHLNLELEHILDACLPGDHLASLVAIQPFACEKKRFAQKSLQTDRQTDDGRRAIALTQ